MRRTPDPTLLDPNKVASAHDKRLKGVPKEPVRLIGMGCGLALEGCVYDKLSHADGGVGNVEDDNRNLVREALARRPLKGGDIE